MKIAFFGGTFNPPHVGHINLINRVNDIFHFDKILLVPSNLPPHKPADNSVSPQDRYNMCLLAQKQINGSCTVSRIELDYPGKSYSVITLRRLKEKYPGDDICFVMGSDMFLSLDRWYMFEEIISMCSVVAAARNDNEYELMISKADELRKRNKNVKINIVNIKVVSISSTAIRDIIKCGGNADKYLTADIYSYIVKNRLYV